MISARPPKHSTNAASTVAAGGIFRYCWKAWMVAFSP